MSRYEVRNGRLQRTAKSIELEDDKLWAKTARKVMQDKIAELRGGWITAQAAADEKKRSRSKEYPDRAEREGNRRLARQLMRDLRS